MQEQRKNTTLSLHLKLLDTYVEYRRRYGEKFASDSPLFREQFDVNDQLSDIQRKCRHSD